MELPDRSQARSWEGRDVVDRDGQLLGRCVGVFADTATGVPEWLHVDVEGHVSSFVPALEAAETDGSVRVQFSRDAVLSAPSVGDDVQLSKAEEIDLYRHYGVPVDSGEGSVLPADDASAAGDSTSATGTAAAGTAVAAGAVTPVVGTSDRTGTGAASSSGADTSVAETDADVDGRLGARTGDTTALTPTSADDDAGTSPLSDAGTVSGGAVTPETGEQLPVLDPAAASTPVAEEQVDYVDEPESSTDGGSGGTTPAPATAEQPRPALRRVPPASPPPPAPVPSSSGSDLSALTPLGAVAGVAAAVALVLRARERRERRAHSAAARAGRLGDSLRAGSALALSSAGSTLAGVSDAAELTRRSAATATSKAAAASRRQGAQTASALAAASKTAAQQKKTVARSAASQRKAAKAALDAAAQTAGQRRKAAGTSLTAASKTADKRRKAAVASLSASTSRGSSSASSVAAVPGKVAKRGRKARKSLGRKLWNLVLLGAGGGGYVLGAKAGRQRYDELSQVAGAVAESPQVQSATEALTDPERRADLLAEVQQQAGSLVGRRGEPRS